ncbi:MAG: T9SS type A sorting domain-containing protein, partial [Bacteroidales bacterium]|nr:T9SS type A sorting domain-containing protein [Bacteroidales bacterium]
YYFTCAAEEVFINDDGNYSMPYIQAVSPGEFVGNGSATADPVTVNYITGIEFPDLCPVGISEMVDASAINVTQNQPNPFNGETYIEVSTQTAAPVMVEVSNIMGQSIYTLNAGTVNGSKTISLNSENMEAGVYFYTVSVGSQSITKKMVVK